MTRSRKCPGASFGCECWQDCARISAGQRDKSSDWTMAIGKRLPDLIAGLWLGLLALYILAGAAIVPFHGDESTLFYMGRDFYYLAVEGDLSKLAYNPSEPEIDSELALRLHNGTVSKMVYGWIMASNGRALREFNPNWDWQLDFKQNVARNSIPSEAMLRQGRMASAVQLALAVAVFFFFAQRVLKSPDSVSRDCAARHESHFAVERTARNDGRESFVRADVDSSGGRLAHPRAKTMDIRCTWRL